MGRGGLAVRCTGCCLFCLTSSQHQPEMCIYINNTHREHAHMYFLCVCVFQLFLDREGSRVFASIALVVVQMVSGSVQLQ